MEEFRKPLRQLSPRPRRWSSTTDRDHLLDHLLLLGSPVLEQAEPDELPDQLHRRLRILLFLQGHIYVIDHEDAFHESSGGTDHSPRAHSFELVLD
jgi:hypothetical protein